MNLSDTIALLGRLTAAHGVSGDEGEVRDLIASLAEPYCDALRQDVMGNLIDCCDALVSGNYQAETVPGMFPGMPERTVVKKGTVMVTFKEGGIHEPKAE